jgi:hypothetical protein
MQKVGILKLEGFGHTGRVAKCARTARLKGVSFDLAPQRPVEFQIRVIDPNYRRQVAVLALHFQRQAPHSIKETAGGTRNWTGQIN